MKTFAESRTRKHSLLVVGLFLLAPAMANGATYYVGTTANQSDGGDCTNPANTDCSLNDAINAATLEGDIVQIDATGSYASTSATITGHNITIKSTAGTGVKLVSDGSSKPVLTFTSSSVTASTIIEGVTIDNAGAGAAETRGVHITDATPTFKDCIIEGNESRWGAGKGAGIYILGTGGATVDNTIIRNNHTLVSGETGGGIYHGGTGTLTIQNGSSIESNSSYKGGGGIYLNLSSVTSISDSTIKSNLTSGSVNGGAGIYMAGGTLTINRTFIIGNEASGTNDTSDGGGINIITGTATITNTVIAGNVAGTAFGSEGGGIKNLGTLNLYFSTIADNFSQSNGGGLFAGGTENIYNSIIWGNGADHATIGHEDVSGTLDTDNNNLTADATFTTRSAAAAATPTTNGVYTLQATSVAIDAGNATNAPSDDIVKNTRPVDTAGKGDGVDDYDQGAYEYGTAPVANPLKGAIMIVN